MRLELLPCAASLLSVACVPIDNPLYIEPTTPSISPSSGDTGDADGSTLPPTSGSSGGSGSSSGSSGSPPPECTIPGDCGSNQTCDAGTCVDACGGAWGVGSYDPCLDAFGRLELSGACSGHPSITCLTFPLIIEASVCSFKGCTDACDCPSPPMTGDAVVTCSDITSGNETYCYLSCANGETCPDGMSCKQWASGSGCMSDVADLALYGNCVKVAAPCSEGACLTDNGHGACLRSHCMTAAECGMAPPGAASTPTCGDALGPPMGSECYLPCVSNDDCPSAMVCHVSSLGTQLCMWPPP